MNVTGKTFASDVFLDVAVTDHGQPIADGSAVTFDAVPATTGEATPSGGTPVHVTAVTSGGHAKFVPELAADGTWLMTWSVSGPAGDGSAPPQKVGIDPHHPPASMPFEVASVATPMLAVVLLLAFFRWRHMVLEQWPASRELASDRVRRRALQLEVQA